MASTTTTTTPRPVSAGALLWAGLVAVLAGIVLVGGLRLLLGALVAIDPALQPYQWGPTLASVVGFGVAATVVYGLLDRYTDRTGRNFLALAAVVFALMLLPVFLVGPSLGLTSLALQAGLVALHAAAAVGIAGGVLVVMRRA